MNKALKKYGKAKWLNVALSHRYKIRRARMLFSLAPIAAQGIAQVRAIASLSPCVKKGAASMSALRKRVAIASVAINTFNALSTTSSCIKKQ